MFDKGLFQIVDRTDPSLILDLTRVGTVNAANVVIRNATGAIVDFSSIGVGSVPQSDNFDPVIGKNFITRTVDFTASQTKQAIWDPGDSRFVITDYHLSFSAAGAITVFDGDADDVPHRVFKYNGATNGGANHAYRKPRRSVALKNKLYYTTGTGAAGSLTIEGYIDAT